MAADDAALEDLDAIERIEAGGLPVTGVRARSDARIAILGHRDDVMRIPDLVVRVVGFSRVVVNANADVELLHERFDDVELVGLFGGDAVEAELLAELKNLAPLVRVLP